MAKSLRQFLERVISSGLLSGGMVRLAERGATSEELDSVTLPRALRDLLAWRNGLNLDVVRIHGLGDARNLIESFPPGQDAVGLAFGSDPAGFVYLLMPDESVLCFDTDGGDHEIVARSVDDFLRSYVFGAQAASFAGPEWARRVSAALGEG